MVDVEIINRLAVDYAKMSRQTIKEAKGDLTDYIVLIAHTAATAILSIANSPEQTIVVADIVKDQIDDDLQQMIRRRWPN